MVVVMGPHSKDLIYLSHKGPSAGGGCAGTNSDLSPLSIG